MEDTLGEVEEVKDETEESGVLILVLMEDTLGENQASRQSHTHRSLNPCFNGRYSRRNKQFKQRYEKQFKS